MTFGADLVQPDLAILSFRNFVGNASLAGVEIDVVSTKLGPDGVSKLLQEVSEVSSSIIFGWRAPLSFSAAALYRNRNEDRGLFQPNVPPLKRDRVFNSVAP